MSVKSDHKGRLTGAEPNTEYYKTTDAFGVITYDPVVVNLPDNEKTVSWDEFTEFFGVEPADVLGTGIQSGHTGKNIKPGTLPHVLQVRTFVRDGDGGKTHDENNEVRTRVLRIHIAEKEED